MEFDENAKIAIIGYYNSKELYRFEEFKELIYLMGVSNSQGLINGTSRINFIKYYIGFNGNFITESNELEELMKNEKVKQMNIYPYYGSIQKIDDIIVVKLSDEQV